MSEAISFTDVTRRESHHIDHRMWRCVVTTSVLRFDHTRTQSQRLTETPSTKVAP
jgi:hypothetical protein